MINLAVQNAMKSDAEVSDLLRKCRNIVGFHRRKAQSCSESTVCPEHKLIQYVETKWTSVYYIFERLVEQNEAVSSALCLLNKRDMAFDENEVELLKKIVGILQPFERATKEMFEEQYLCISKMISIATLLQRKANEWQSEKEVVRKLRAEMSSQFARLEVDKMLTIPTFLDPRFKSIAFSCASTAADIKELLLVEMRMVPTAPLAPAEKGQEQQGPESREQDISWGDFDGRVIQSTEARPRLVDHSSELQDFSRVSNIRSDHR